MEVIISSEATGQLWNMCVWDGTSGMQLHNYKGGISAAKTLTHIGGQYLISAEQSKPLLHVWPVNKKDQVQIRTVCGTPARALAVSADGVWCVAGIGENLHVWQISTGRLHAVLSRHYQQVTGCAFTDDGSHFVSIGEDGLCLVWLLCAVVSVDEESKSTPLHVLSAHSLPVTDLHVGRGGHQARVATCSLDQTCKVYSIGSGELLLSLAFSSMLTSVCMDPAELHLFCGDQKGQIFTTNLTQPPSTVEHYVTEEEKKKGLFKGHTKSISCMDVSMSGLLLLSGCLDETVRVWDIPSHQCLRTLTHKGGITNAFFMFVSSNIFSNDYPKPNIVVKSLKRSVEDTSEGTVEVSVSNKVSSVWSKREVSTADDDAPDAEETVNKLQSANIKLYQTVLDKIMA